MRRFVTAYGAHPVHLLMLLACFALAGYAALRLVPSGPLGVAVWFVGAAVVHDLVLLPAYALVDSGLARVLGRRRDAASGTPRVPVLNYVRLPLLLSALLLLVFAPSILRLSDRYAQTTGLSSQHYLQHWLLVTAALFGLSALCYLARLRSIRRREHRKVTKD